MIEITRRSLHQGILLLPDGWGIGENLPAISGILPK